MEIERIRVLFPPGMSGGNVEVNEYNATYHCDGTVTLQKNEKFIVWKKRASRVEGARIDNTREAPANFEIDDDRIVDVVG